VNPKYKTSSEKVKYSQGLKILFNYLKPYRKTFIYLSALSVFSAFASSTIPYLSGRLIDSLIANQLGFLFLIILWLAVKLIADSTNWIIGVKGEHLEEDIEADYIVSGVSKILDFPLRFHKSRKMGEVFDRIGRAANNLSMITARLGVDLAPEFLSIFFAFAITFSLKPRLAAILLGAMLLYILVIFRAARKVGKLFILMHRAYNKAYGDAYDAVLNVATVKQATAENYEKKKVYRNFRLRAAGFWKRIATLWQSLSFSQRVIITLTQFSIFIYSYFLIRSGELTIGQLVMFNGYAAMLFGPIVILARNWQVVQNGLVSLIRAEKILNYPPEIYVPKGAVILPELKGNIIFNKVNFYYREGKEKILDDISFKVKAGETVAIVGESGVGKTTLVDLISFYYPPTSGAILIDGKNIKKLDLRFLRTQIAVVPQEIILFNDTIGNNIHYGKFDAADDEIKNAAVLAHAAEFIEKFPKKYKQIVGERGIKLSSGQKQRVAIARALLRNPRILILDEPTSALDARSEKAIQESLEKLMVGRTTFIIAHRLSTVRKADKILVFDKGRLVETGRHEELIQNPKSIYCQLYKLQLG
jgi:ABC-type multidrug transport system fused ATPase/permease subunit